MKKTIVSVVIMAVIIAGLSIFAEQAEYFSAKCSLPSKENCVEKSGEDYWYSYEFWQEIADWSAFKGEKDSKEIAQEYILIRNESFIGTRCLHVKIYTDKTGKITDEYCKEGEEKVSFANEISLNSKQTSEIIYLVKNNGFWSKKCATSRGLDGHCIMIEGVKANNYNFLDSWCPKSDSVEWKTYYGVYDLYQKWR